MPGHKGKMGGGSIRSTSYGRQPKVSAEELKLLHKHLPTVKAAVDKRAGSWGDVAKDLSKKSGIEVNGSHAIWLHAHRKRV